MMTTYVYSIQVSEVDTQLAPDGTDSTLIPVARYAVEAPTVEDALIALGEQLAAEEAS